MLIIQITGITWSKSSNRETKSATCHTKSNLFLTSNQNPNIKIKLRSCIIIAIKFSDWWVMTKDAHKNQLCQSGKSNINLWCIRLYLLSGGGLRWLGENYEIRIDSIRLLMALRVIELDTRTPTHCLRQEGSLLFRRKAKPSDHYWFMLFSINLKYTFSTFFVLSALALCNLNHKPHRLDSAPAPNWCCVIS